MNPQGRNWSESAHMGYVRPPIVEALCQFNFASPIRWSPVLPGLFYDRVRTEYPADPEVQQQVQANVEFDNDAAGQAQFTLGQGEQRIVFKNDQSNRLIVLNSSSVSANSLPEYEGWDSLSQRFHRTLAMTKEVLQGAEVGMVTIRYVNRVVVPTSNPLDVGDWFNIPFRKVGGNDAELVGAFQRVETTLADRASKAILNFGPVDAIEGEREGQAFMLDLEFRRELDSSARSLDDAFEVAHQLKSAENAEFESCITDRVRGLFQ